MYTVRIFLENGSTNILCHIFFVWFHFEISNTYSNETKEAPTGVLSPQKKTKELEFYRKKSSNFNKECEVFENFTKSIKFTLHQDSKFQFQKFEFGKIFSGSCDILSFQLWNWISLSAGDSLLAAHIISLLAAHMETTEWTSTKNVLEYMKYPNIGDVRASLFFLTYVKIYLIVV